MNWTKVADSYKGRLRPDFIEKKCFDCTGKRIKGINNQ